LNKIYQIKQSVKEGFFVTKVVRGAAVADGLIANNSHTVDAFLDDGGK